MGTVTLIVNGIRCQAEEREKVLEVSFRNGFSILYLCHQPALDPYGACRLCLVEVVGGPWPLGLTTSCTLPATESVFILTESPLVVRHRSVLLEMYLSMAPNSERVRELAEKHGVRSSRFEKRAGPDDPLGGKCVLCGLCVRVCHHLMGAGAVDFVERGSMTILATPFLEPSSACTGCGACAAVCSTGAISMEDYRHVGLCTRGREPKYLDRMSFLRSTPSPHSPDGRRQAEGRGGDGSPFGGHMEALSAMSQEKDGDDTRFHAASISPQPRGKPLSLKPTLRPGRIPCLPIRYPSCIPRLPIRQRLIGMVPVFGSQATDPMTTRGKSHRQGSFTRHRGAVRTRAENFPLGT